MTSLRSRTVIFSSAALSLGAVLLCCLAGSARAGIKGANNVYVNATSRLAQGDLGQARNSPDSMQLIGCYIQSYRNASGLFEQVTCEARDVAGAYYSCYATEAELVRSARSLTGDSFLSFFGDASGKCVNILVAHNSVYQPKAP
jgi:hypothetical protein